MYGERIRQLRKERGITMKEFGRLFHLAESTISGYETEARKPDIVIVEKFANFFDVSTDYLLGRTNIRKMMPSAAGSWAEDDTVRQLIEDQEFMDAYKNMPGSREEAKEDLITFMKLMQKRHKKSC